MIKKLLLVTCCLAAMTMYASAQTVIITDFPVGVGGSVDRAMFQPYLDDLKTIADTLHKYPLARAIVTGGADGIAYRTSHDAKNPGLALGRAHLLRNLLIAEFNVDSTQIIVQSEDIAIKGGLHRFASVRIDRGLADLETRVDALEKRPPIEKHFTEVVEPAASPSPFENFGLLFGLGASSSPFGGIPMISSALTWGKTVYVEGFAGHTFWDGEFEWEGATLDTKRRMIGAQVIVFPYERVPLGVVAGWVRVEEISQQHYEYTKLSEGPVIGLRAMPLKFISVTGTYNPAKRRTSGYDLSTFHNDQLQISAAAHIAFGGAK